MVFPCNSLVRNRWAPRNLCCHLGCLLEHSLRIVAVSSWAANLNTVPSQRWGHADMPTCPDPEAMTHFSQTRKAKRGGCTFAAGSLNLIWIWSESDLQTRTANCEAIESKDLLWHLLLKVKIAAAKSARALQVLSIVSVQVERCRELTRCAVQVQAAASSQLAPCRLCKETN